ncbi:MAG TPA: fibrillarin-like rRNA/tRNA 2'-O-methyltransferase [Candidatus Korarchaeota archaeon]|nr:MAG: fibrillarin-like rRNA/tRNA 2'-O-methyltransferase [Candidatus Korarchaeota archaeon]HDD69206.1 fibrillarin-like rRNA/tRNA 2'-O-methyltransferase [Candidatus Korarchaeota archaeon]
MIKPDQKFPGVFWIQIGRKKRNLATKNLVPGFRSYDERVVRVKGEEYRIWSPERSKPAAAIIKGLKYFPIRPGIKILYLGIASGTTASHFSDIVGKEGIIFGIEVAERVVRELIDVSAARKNIVPILASARSPESYINIVSMVDVVYADVAQPDQVDILIKNCKVYLKDGGYAMIAVKASSIDVTKPPKEVYKMAERQIRGAGYEIIQTVELAPFDRKHAIIVARS